MANKKFWVGMLVMVLVFGMAVVGCDTGSGNGTTGGGGHNGSWAHVLGGIVTETITTYNNGNFEIAISGIVTHRGTYVINGSRITRTYTYGTLENTQNSGIFSISGNTLSLSQNP